MAEAVSIGFVPGASAGFTNAEAALVVQAQAGETTAFDSLMRTYRERVFSVVLNLTNNRADAADVTQDVFIKAFTNIQKYNFKSSFFTWIYRIAVNEALNQQRKARSKKMSLIQSFQSIIPSFSSDQKEQTEDERLSSLGADASAKSHQPTGALNHELHSQLDKALQSLSEEHRTVIVLTEIEGLPLQEAADILGVGQGTVKSRLHYAKKRLQTLLKPYLSV